MLKPFAWLLIGFLLLASLQEVSAIAGFTVLQGDNASNQSTNLTTYTPLVLLNNPSTVNGAKYVVIVTGETRGTSSSYQTRVNIYYDGVLIAYIKKLPTAASTPWFPYSFVYLATGDGGDQLLNVSFSSNNVAGTAESRNVHANIFRLDNLTSAEYYSNYSAASGGNLDNTWANQAFDAYNVTVTAGTAGLYAVLASAEVHSISTSRSIETRVEIDGGAAYLPVVSLYEYSQYNSIEDASTAQTPVFGTFAYVNLTAGVHNISYQARSYEATGNTSTWLYKQLLVFRLDGTFNYTATNTTNEVATGAGTTWVFRNNLTATVDGTYLALVGENQRRGASGYMEEMLNVTNTAYASAYWTLKDVKDYLPFAWAEVITRSGSDQWVRSQYRQVDAGTVYMKSYYAILINTAGGGAPPADSCTYGGAGNWLIQNVDNCVITANYALGGANLSTNGTSGVTQFKSNLTGVGFWTLDGSWILWASQGARIIS